MLASLDRAFDVLVALGAASAVVLTVAGGVSARRGVIPGLRLVVLAVVVEVALLGLAVVALLAYLDGGGPQGSSVLFVSYLLTMLLVPPAAIVWAAVERDRWSSAVLAVAAFTVACMVLRLWDLWRGGVQIGGPGG